jgi:hypothetical protein
MISPGTQAEFPSALILIPGEHLLDDDFHVLVVDIHSLRCVNPLDFSQNITLGSRQAAGFIEFSQIKLPADNGWPSFTSSPTATSMAILPGIW